MAKLFCAVVGVGSVFSVEIDISETVDDLKKKIKEEKPGLIHFDADLLKLYLAREGGAWLNSQDDELEKLMSGEISDRVKNLMRKELLLKETRNLNNDAYFGKTFERAEDDIHVLVELPSPDVAARGIDVAPFEQMKMAVNEAFEERDRKRSVYSISTCPRSKEILLKQQLGLEYSTVRVNEVIDDSINGYQWSALTEKHPDQRKAYMKYVEEHLGDGLKPSGEQKDFLKDVAGNRGLLDCDDPSRLPFKVKGTADMMIIDESANRMNNVFAGLRFVIEVKKDRPSMNEQWQLLLELVAADLKSETSCAPVGLLTNLNDYWFFLWFAPDNRIARMVLTCPANGFKTIIEVLKERSGPTRDGDFPMRVAFLDSSLPLKRQKLPRSAIGPDDAAAEMLERYELMADELDPEFLQQQRIDYAFDLIRRMPIHSSMYT